MDERCSPPPWGRHQTFATHVRKASETHSGNPKGKGYLNICHDEWSMQITYVIIVSSASLFLVLQPACNYVTSIFIILPTPYILCQHWLNSTTIVEHATIVLHFSDCLLYTSFKILVQCRTIMHDYSCVSVCPFVMEGQRNPMTYI